MADIRAITEKLRKQGCDATLVDEVVEALKTEAIDEAEGRIIRTNKGALMVRVSPDRWPIAMYAKDWKIILSMVPAIEHALKTLDILETNPDPTNKQRTQQQTSTRSVQVARGQRVREEDEGEERAA